MRRNTNSSESWRSWRSRDTGNPGDRNYGKVKTENSRSKYRDKSLNEGSRENKNFSFNYLKNLVAKPLDEIMNKLSANDYFFGYIGKKISPDSIVLIVQLLSKITDFSFSRVRVTTIQKMLSSGFVDNLQLYIVQLSYQTSREKQKNSHYWEDPDSFWNNLVKFCTVSMNENPNFFIDNLLKLVKISIANISEIERNHSIHVCDEIKNNLKYLVDKAEKFEEDLSSKLARKVVITDDTEEEPPNDFRNINILPSTQELLHAEKLYLRKNIIIGPYRDVNHYLDIQFRLLREDFVGPLRRGIQALLSGEEYRNIQDIKIHKKVKFLNPVAATENYCVLLNFHSGGKLGNFKFEDSKKFMFGSLVCFTKDNFKNILFGRIVDRKIDYLKKGQFVVGFNRMEQLSYDTDYVMVECSIFFEPYYHVLTVLKQIEEHHFPMKNYIVDVDKTVLMPEFANASTVYTIEDDRCQIFNLNQIKTFSDLNESQNEAFIAAITRQFCIIQGPPGTGKTHVGLKIARTLLENSKVWCKNSPMLVICFTNHALDQFLEGLIDTTDQMIRVGGQSKNEQLKKYNLNMRGRKMNPAVWRTRNDVSSELENIKRVTDQLKAISDKNCILNFRRFQTIINNYHVSWLAKATHEEILEWLLGEGISTYKNNLVDNEKNFISLLEPSQNEKNDESDDDDDEQGHEDDEFADLFGGKNGSTDSLLDLNQLLQQITCNNNNLNQLFNQMYQDEEKQFQYFTLKLENDHLKQTYDIAMHYLKSMPSTVTEDPMIDVKESKFIPIRARWNLYLYWVNLYKEKLLDEYERYNERYRKTYELYSELKEMGNIEILRSVKVIGMTTTGAARLHSTLRVLKCPIVIVEEAAEVLEAHIVSALTESCKQLILIGDHQQLRPTTANFKIGKDFHLGVSLFERMIRNEVQCFTLDTQHRMRPEISSLIKPTIYPNLKDHSSVLDRPPIRGVDKCLFFIDHEQPEDTSMGNSKINMHEVKFLIELAKYLILNGYESSQITILAAYLGQMFAFQREKRKMHLLKDVRISVLDNYQGEESDIILLSLVRNNENTIGFLSIDNRVCVALSRARNGLYIMGNMSLLSNHSKLWTDIRQTLIRQEALGQFLALKCYNHSRITMVSSASNFSSVSEGGCDQICDNLLICGHRCKRLCHYLDKDHENYNCPEICNKNLCNLNLTHLCKKRCGEECGPCTYPKHVTLDCGHGAVIECYVNPEDHECREQIKVTLPCTHEAIKPCYIDVNIFKCEVPCDARLDCGHACAINCHVFKDPDHIKYKCLKPCAKFRSGCTNLVDDQHKCSKLCFEKCEPCKKPVRKARTVCPHFYDVPCSQNVDEIECRKPCSKKLECGHLCRNTCDDVCTTICQQKVTKQIPGCNHNIKLLCYQEPNKLLCNKKCPRIMDCGHVCERKCNEPCDASKCKVMVNTEILGKCGHIIKRVPCFVKSAYRIRGEVEDLESYCSEPCTVMLNCSSDDKHRCAGTCGTCFQGRIHRRCIQKCNRILICDHECSGYCRESCKPCSKKCSFKCKHSTCKKPCGDRCTPCTENCTRRCIHQKCTKMCGEICNIPPCESPCIKKLPCGHPCIGFCKEPCPPLCRICNETEVKEVFFGTEDEEDARFVLLNDCGHIVESTGMKHWLNQETGVIKFKVCPRCKTKIFTTDRYSEYVKEAIKAISAVKIKGIGTKKEITEKCLDLENKLKALTFPTTFPALILNFKKDLLDSLQKTNKDGRVRHINLIDLNVIEIKYQFFERIRQILIHADIGYFSNKKDINNQLTLLYTVLKREMYDISKMEIEDIEREVNRLQRMVQVLPLLHKLSYNSDGADDIKALNNQINNLNKYDDQIDKSVKEKLEKLRNKYGILAITELEKQEIVKEIGLTKGHWYQCPNGHPYAIADCGGAMEKSTCPDCHVTIGGENHRLVETNRVASFMDGATHSAWSEHNNILNYQLNFF